MMGETMDIKHIGNTVEGMRDALKVINDEVLKELGEDALRDFTGVVSNMTYSMKESYEALVKDSLRSESIPEDKSYELEVTAVLTASIILSTKLLEARNA